MSVSHQPADPAVDHDHDHPHREQPPLPSRAGSVVLELGGDIGALCVTTAEDMAGAELEIRAAGTEWRGVHVAVLPRLLPTGTLFAALFASVPAGRYEVRRRDRDDEHSVTATVEGGRVTTVGWAMPASATDRHLDGPNRLLSRTSD